MSIAQAMYSVPLVDLGESKPSFSGVLAPQAPGSREAVGVSTFFLENAEEYHKSYTATEYFARLIRDALDRVGIHSDIQNILDIGSGSGNSVYPLLRFFPDANVIASDISPQLLCILRDHLESSSDLSRLSLICADAGKNFFHPNSFDLVVGAAILHHMVDPIATIKSCISALKPGRHAIFFEPFAGGNCMLRLAYRRILAHPQAKYLPFSATNALIHMLQMYQACMDVEPTDPAWQQMDDKWMFTPSYLFDAGKQAGGCETIIYPLHSLEDPYSSQTVSNLRIMGAEREALPGWGWEILHEFDTLMPRRVKEDLLIEGCVIFKK